MQPRITGPALSLPGVPDAFQALGAPAGKAGLPQATADLVHCASARSTAAQSASTCTPGP